MLDRLFNTHLTDLQNSLDRTSKRQSLLMTNLANSNVPGYKRKDLDFHITLAQEMGQTPGQTPGLASHENNNDFESEIRVDGSNVDMEREAVGISDTELRFQAVTDMTSNYFSNLKNAIREGK